MSRLLWFVLGGIATAIGAGVAAVMLEGESEGDSSDETEEGQEAIEPQDDTEASEPSALITTTRIAGGLLQPYKGITGQRLNDAGFHFVQAQCRCHLGLPLEGVSILTSCQSVLHDIMLFLLLNIFFDSSFVQTHGAYIVSLCPKFSVAELVFQVCVFIKNH